MAYTKAYVQVLNLFVKDGAVCPSFYTLWTAGNMNKAVANAKKRSIENPELVFRAIETSNPHALFNSSHRTNYRHAAAYYVAGAEYPFNPISAYVPDGKSAFVSPEWESYMEDVFLSSLIDVSGQKAISVHREVWYNPLTYSSASGWQSHNEWDTGNKLVAHQKLSQSRSRYSGWGDGLMRMTYTHPDGSVEVEPWNNNTLITEEAANAHIDSVMAQIEWRKQRILDGKWAGSRHLSDVIGNAVVSVGLQRMQNAFVLLERDLIAVSEHGRLTDEQRERINAAAQLMSAAAELMNEG